MNKHTSGVYKDYLYFSSTQNYTLALLNAFNGTKFWVDDQKEKQKMYTVPITFASYEKSVAMDDLSNTDILQQNYNFLPRMVLSFNGMTKASDRQTNKYQKFSKKLSNLPGRMDVAYNSVSYDFNYTLLVQARGLTIASAITEEILVKFNPSLALEIKEMPLFDERTQTQILISDPSFEIIEEMGEHDVNIVNVTFDVSIRGNIYSPIEIAGNIETVKMFLHSFSDFIAENAKLAAYYRFDVDPDKHTVTKETQRAFQATEPKTDVVESTDEQEVIENRTDYEKYQIETDIEGQK